MTDKKTGRILLKHMAGILMMLASVLIIIFVSWESGTNAPEFSLVDNSTLHYVRAQVISVDSEDLAEDTLENGRMAGTQDITVKILDGSMKGQTVSLVNYVTRSVNVVCKAGTRIIVCADIPDNAEPYYTVFSYDRMPGIAVIIIIFVMIVLLVGRRTGGLSILGLAYTIFVIFAFLIKLVYYGGSVHMVSVVTVILSSIVSLYLIGGFSRKMLAAFCATVIGTIYSGMLFIAASGMLHLTGYNLDTAESLILIRNITGMDVKNLIFAAVMIAALGAVMDVAVSVSSSLSEIHTLNPGMPASELFRSGMNIGRDMTGTMTNTLILAFVSSAFVTLILLKGYGYEFQQILNSDWAAIELAQGLSSTAAVILTVPTASFFASRILTAQV